MKKVLLIGAGGHCKVVLDVLLQNKNYSIIGIIDLKKNIGSRIFDIGVIGDDNGLKKYFKRGIKHCFITIGSTGNPEKRIKIYKFVKEIGYNLINVISSNSIISNFASIGEGCYFAPGSIINADSVLGNNCIVNTGAKIDHDCLIGDNIHISPGVTLSAGVKIGNATHVGTGSSIIQYVTIGNNTLIGAGSVVTKDIPSNVIAYGNPCKIIRKIHE